MTFPLGPYHPALTEPVSLRFALRGELVTGVEMHTGYLRRGVPALATQRDLAGALDLVERMCGTCGHSHRLAMCLALEQAAQVTPPPRAQALRMMFAEVERALARLWLLMEVGRVSDFGALFNLALEAREMIFEGCVAATEARLFWGIPVPGGAVNVADPGALADAMSDVTSRLMILERQMADSGSLASRMANIGKIQKATAEELGLTGLLLRASGGDADVRLSAPYENYLQHTDTLTTTDPLARHLVGDVMSRVRLALAELRLSLRLIQEILDDLPEGQERATFPSMISPVEANATVEGPHGSETVTLTLGANVNGGQRADLDRPGWLQALSLQTPSTKNINILPIVLNKQMLGDEPIVYASLGLCLAC
ncbi:MAG TPA: nickel-dependent hydrogenase large subunit, partial [Ktedonobacterales bacterium]|nr:nickel-dependent hydrogenase large subunit [Ktedonobacterales bacterium]